MSEEKSYRPYMRIVIELRGVMNRLKLGEEPNLELTLQAEKNKLMSELMHHYEYRKGDGSRSRLNRRLG